MKSHFSSLHTITTEPYNAETPHAALMKDITPTDLFYVRNHFAVPIIDAGDWALELGGAVEKPLQFSLLEIQKLPPKTLNVILECAGNGRSTLNPAPNGTPWNLGAVSQARFTGTSLNNLFKELTISRDAIEMLFVGADQGTTRTNQTTTYARSLPLEVALHPDTMLAWEMNGEPLPLQHGYPLRLVVPGWYGMASVKWLRQISLLRERFEGFFQKDEYVYVGESGIPDGTPVTSMRARALIVEPSPEAILPAGEVQLAGIAWSGEGSITRVELSFDDGATWLEADLETARSSYSSQRWKFNWNMDIPGQYAITVRATDSRGNVQPLTQRWNKGGYGNNKAQQVTVSIN